MKQEKPIIRDLLLRAELIARPLTAIEVNKITMEPKQKGGLHLHPCPVTGYIAEGTAVMQVEGEEAKILNKGDAFYEPADTHILQFGNYSDKESMTFIAFYLLNGDQELIKML